MEYRSPRFRQVASTGVLLIAAFIWGMCFVAQRSGMEHIGPFLFNGIRELLGAAALLAVLLATWLAARLRGPRGPAGSMGTPGGSEEDIEVSTKTGLPVGGTEEGIEGSTKEARPSPPSRWAALKPILAAGLLCGLALFCASNSQQIGLVYVTASKAAFITTLYIVLVPVLGLFLRHRAFWNTWVSVGLAVVGLYLLCVGDVLTLEFGDAALLACALFWAVHILAVGHYAPRLSLLQLFGMCVVQFAVTGILSLLAAPFVDHLFVPATVTMEAVATVLPELLYAGILSTAVAFTLMAVGQRYAKPTPAAIVMSTESVFGLLGGVLILGEALTLREGIGCLLMLAAVILTQLDVGPAARGAPRKKGHADEENDAA